MSVRRHLVLQAKKSCSLAAMMLVAACNSGIRTPQGATDVEPDIAIEEAGPTLQLELADESTDSAEVRLAYNRRPDQVGPRVVELMLGLSSNLEYRASRALDTAHAAQKQLVVQPREHGLRVMLFSTTSLEPLESGYFAAIELERKDEREASVTLLNGGETFAPNEANEGFVPPEPLTFGGR